MSPDEFQEIYPNLMNGHAVKQEGISSTNVEDTKQYKIGITERIMQHFKDHPGKDIMIQELRSAFKQFR